MDRRGDLVVETPAKRRSRMRVRGGVGSASGLGV